MFVVLNQESSFSPEKDSVLNITSTIIAMADSVSPYTIDNLPYGVISTSDKPKKRCAVAFEESAIDIDQLYNEGFFSSIAELKDNVFAHVSRSWYLD